MPGSSAPSVAPGAPTLSRRHAAGSPSARGLLLTVLGEFVLTNGGIAWTSTVIEVLGRLGVAEKASRQALMRTAAAGWLASERVGRRTRWQLTGSAHRLLTEGAERIYSFIGPMTGWDGRWLLISARIPETDRAARHIVRTRLSWAGFGSLGGGLWISPHPDRQAEAAGVLREAGIAEDAHMFVAHRTGLAEIDRMVRTAWDLGAIEEQYEQFLAEFRGRSPADVLVRQVELVHAWRRFPAIDPALPRELLPARWSGLTAATLFDDRHRRWAAGAQREWLRLNDGG